MQRARGGTNKVFTVCSVVGPGCDFTAMSLIARLKRSQHDDKNLIHGLKRRALASWTFASCLDRSWPRQMLGILRAPKTWDQSSVNGWIISAISSQAFCTFSLSARGFIVRLKG